MLTLIPRLVGFGADGKAVGAGFAFHVSEAPRTVVLHLPSDSPDWIGPYRVEGKTEAQIRADVAAMGF